MVFAIAGSGSSRYRRRLQREAGAVADIVRLGTSDGNDLLAEEMPTLYRRAKICVLPSRREGFGQVLLEAAAFRCPVVGANTGGIPEIIDGFNTGLLFSRDEPEDLATQLCQLLESESLRDFLVAGAAAQLVRRVDSEIMAREYLKLYQRVAGIRLK